MKKRNLIMRIALIVLVLTLATACMVSGTFAKYVTTSEGSDTANVAAWGITVDVSGFAAAFDVDEEVDGAYSTLYDTDAIATLATATSLIAPGTSGSFDAGWAGTSEVPYTISIEAKITYNGTWIGTDGDDYTPIVWTLVGEDEEGEPTYTTLTATPVYDTEDTTLLLYYTIDLSAAVSSDAYAPATTISESITIAWAWAFDTTDADGANDADDTLMGLYAANVGSYVVSASTNDDYAVGTILTSNDTIDNVTLTEIVLPTVTIDFAIAATQADNYTPAV